jgi:hypothetical protein
MGILPILFGTEFAHGTCAQISSLAPSSPTCQASGMGQEKSRIQAEDLTGFRDFRTLKPLLKRLHAIGTERDSAGNRKLHMDEYCLLVLMWLYNPVVDSLRGIQQCSGFDSVRKRLGVGRASMGSLSESVSLFEPELLRGIAEELSEQLPVNKPDQFGRIDKQITAVDGSVFKVLAQIAELAWLPASGGKKACGYRLHAQFEVFRKSAVRIGVTSSNPKGEADERVVLEKSVESGRCYLMDRGYEKYALFNSIHAAGSDYVCRIRDDRTWTVVADRPLTQADRAARVISDQEVTFGSPNSRTRPPNHRCRVVIIEAKPHNSGRRSAASSPDCNGTIRIVTNLMDVPAEVIAALYSHRWTIEIYFRTIKQLLGCRHLLSTRQNGVEIQAYLAIIACILIMIHTGRTPTKRTYEILCFYQMGMVTLDEIEAHIRKLKS